MPHVQLIRDRKTGHFYPSSEWDQEKLKHVKPGAAIHGVFRRARNPDHHRKAFALLQAVLQNQERYRSLTDLLTEIKIKAGWYVEHITLDGEIIFIPKSISFAEMGQDEFNEFYDKMLTIIETDFDMKELVAEFA